MRPDSHIGALFQGALPSATTKHLVLVMRRAVELGARRVVNPCSGTLGIAHAAVAAGFPGARIETGDIGLVAAILGTVVAGRSIGELDIRYVDDRLAPAADFVGTELEAGAALAAIKACQYKDDHPYTRLLLEDLLDNWERTARTLQEQVDAKKARLAGCRFAMVDMWDQIAEAVDDPEAVICLFPPAYRGGYDKMFPLNGRIVWREPTASQFDPAWQPRLYALLKDARALALWSFYGELPEDAVDRAIFTEWLPGRKDGQWWLANRAEGLPKGAKTRKETALKPSPWPTWPFQCPVNENTEVRFVETSKACALYYRDLFAHKLGVTRAERYFLVLLDGHVMSVFGMFFDHVERGQNEAVNETFGFSVPSGVHARFNRLFMMLLVCGDSLAFFRSIIRNKLHAISSLQTTCIAQYPELKVNRGILKLRGREQMPDGRYKLDYVANFSDRSFTDTLRAWLAKDGKHAPAAVEEHNGGDDSAGRPEPGNLETASGRAAGAGREREGDAAGDAGAAGREPAEGAAA